MAEKPETSMEGTEAFRVGIRTPRLWLIEIWEEHREYAKGFTAAFFKTVFTAIAVFTEEVVVCIMVMILIGTCHWTCEILIQRYALKELLHWLEFLGITAYWVIAMLCFGRKLWRVLGGGVC